MAYVKIARDYESSYHNKFTMINGHAEYLFDFLVFGIIDFKLSDSSELVHFYVVIIYIY